MRGYKTHALVQPVQMSYACTRKRASAIGKSHQLIDALKLTGTLPGSGSFDKAQALHQVGSTIFPYGARPCCGDVEGAPAGRQLVRLNTRIITDY
jgi:hypothetical protein